MSVPGFWRDMRIDNRRVVVRDFGVISNIHFLFPQGGGPRGAFTTFAELAPNLKTGDTVILRGVLREQAIAPAEINDIAIIGAINRAYQATDSGVPIAGGGGACWLAPTSPTATTPLLELNPSNVGWSFESIMFAPPSDDAGVKITNGGAGAGSSHHVFKNCYFSGGLIGIEDNGGFHHVLVEDCEFRGMAGAGGGGIVCTSTSNAVPLQNSFIRCSFFDCVNGFIASQQNSRIKWCSFDRATTNIISTTFNSGQGGGNHVVQNDFNVVAAEFDPSGSTGAVTGAADDVWYNYLLDAVESGQPA